jgi:hypothetical protein
MRITAPPDMVEREPGPPEAVALSPVALTRTVTRGADGSLRAPGPPSPSPAVRPAVLPWSQPKEVNGRVYGQPLPRLALQILVLLMLAAGN